MCRDLREEMHKTLGRQQSPSFCGQKHFVDIYGTTLVLTAAERPDLRHRTEPKNPDDPEVVQKKKNQDEFKKKGNSSGEKRNTDRYTVRALVR